MTDNYDDLQDPSAVVHALATGNLGDDYSPEQYLAAVENVKA